MRDTDEIRADLVTAEFGSPDWTSGKWSARTRIAHDVPDLLAEVVRLRAAVDDARTIGGILNALAAAEQGETTP
jgi:hypothetical protein